MSPAVNRANQLINYLVQPGGRLTGRVRVPGDKSISHRAVMLGALAEGTTRINGLLEGEDVQRTLEAFRAMGVSITGPEKGRLIIHGVGLHGLKAPRHALDMGNSGTAMRLMAGLLAGQDFDSELIGDASLSKRPMTRVTDPLSAMGASITTTGDGRAPLKIQGGWRLHGIDYRLPVASAQVKSALLLAGLYAEGETTVTEPAPARDHTERLLRGFGYAVETQGSIVKLRGGGRLQAHEIDVPADLSSATFFLVGTAITPGSDLLLEHVGVNPTRMGAMNVLQRMGADIKTVNPREVGGEPVADIRVRSCPLHGIVIPEDQVPLAIDEFPILFIAAAATSGETVLRGAKELRVKESDRISVMAQGLRRLDIDAQETPDGMVIQGGAMKGGEVDSHGDHRVGMAFAIAGLRAKETIIVRDCKNIDTSFPGFVALAGRAGLQITVNRES